MEQPSETMDTMLSEERHCESPVSSVPESARPISLDGASAWRDPTPDLTFSHVEDSNDTVQRLSKIPETEHSSTCHDRGESAHFESSLGHRSSDIDHYSTLSTDELLVAVGTGVEALDPRLEFSDIPPVKIQDKTLEEQLRTATRKYPGDNGQKFIPIGDFDEIVTRDSVRREVQSWLPEDRTPDIWVKAIWDTFDYDDHTTTRRKAFTSRRKIFSILVLLNAQTKIASFIREELWDKDLPFMQNEENKWVYYPRKSHNGTRPIESLNRLEVHDADSFDNYQWFMLSPIFNMAEDRVIHYDLHPRITLPFLEHIRGHDPALIGGQGEVSRIKVHESHRILEKSMKDPPEYFAIKQLMSSDKGHFDAEVESLKRFSNDNHPHLIKLLATYHHKEKFHLIFPWADGNLRDLWKRHPKPTKDYETVRWIANQCRGIAKGLRMIHNNEFKPDKISLRPQDKKMGRHGDMKPENILWFKGLSDNGQFENDVLKISDFGLTRWHRNMSNDKTDIHKLAVSRSYRAPEYDLWGPISQSWDIWSLACLYLEFITWYLWGWDEGVDEFSKDRTKENSSMIREGTYAISEDDFFNLIMKNGPNIGSSTKYEASLKRSVISWINKLHATDGCSRFIHDFLDLISDKMLRIGSEKRTKCKDITDALDELYNKCEDRVYCSESDQCIRKKKRNDSDPPDAHDPVILEFSEEKTKRLSQRISIDSPPKTSNDYHDEAVETEPPITSHSRGNKDHFDTDNSNERISNPRRTERHVSANPLLPDYCTESDSNILPSTATAHGTNHSSQQVIPKDSKQYQSSQLINDRPNTESAYLGLSAINQNQVSPRNTPGSSISSPPVHDNVRKPSSERDGASGQTIQDPYQPDTTNKGNNSITNDNEELPISRWERFLERIKSVPCLGRRSELR